MSDAEAANIIQMVDMAGDKAEFDDLHKDLMAITRSTRQLLLDSGLITPEEYAGWDGLYQNYIPLRGFETAVSEDNPRPGVSRGYSITGQESIKALGRTSKAGDIIENIIRDYERAVIRSEQNNVAKTLLDLVITNPDPDLWEISPMKRKRSFNKASGMVLMTTSPDKGEDTLAAKVAGQEVRIKLKDPLIAHAMKQVGKTEVNQLVRILSVTTGPYTALLRNTLTRYNPIFGGVNAVRDYQMGAASVFDELGAEGVALYLKHYQAAVASSYRKERKTSNSAVNPMDKWMEEMRFAGGTTGGFAMRSVEDITDELRTIMLAAGAPPKGMSEHARSTRAYNAAASMMRWMEIVGSTSENAARVAAYRAARELGKTPAEAASISKNLTTNFNRKGEWGTVLNVLYLFFNAAVQGNVRVLQMLKKRRGQYLMAAVSAAGMTLALLNATAAGDDDDGQAYWDKIPDYVKERNWIIMLPPGVDTVGTKQVGTRGRYISIPLQYGLNVFPVLGYQLADVARWSKDKARGVSPGKAALNVAATLLGALNPFGGAVDFENMSAVGQAISPTIGDLIIQLTSGTNAFGRNVGPPQSPYDDSPDSERTSARQSGSAYEWTARQINAATGGNAARKGAIDVMPGTLENVIQNATGGLGTFIADVTFNLPTKLISPVPVTSRDIPLLKAFYGEVDKRVDIGLYYDRLREVETEMAAAKGEMELGLVVDYTDMQITKMGLAKASESYTKLMRDFRKHELAIDESETMSWGEKRLQKKELEKFRADMAKSFNSLYVDVMGDAKRRE
jgi:hypothetical protein